jgi:hypothetical protein
VAVNEIIRCSGTQFDPDCAHPFSEAIEDERTEKMEKGEPVPE